MKEIKETCYKGTRILLGNMKRDLINDMVFYLKENGFMEISIPIIQFQEIFKDKVGDNSNLMFNFHDRADRLICLAPEYTAVVQRLASTEFKGEEDVKLFYVQECFRGEKPQAGRYRQFTQLGVEILNPTRNWNSYLTVLAHDLCIKAAPVNYLVNGKVTRGLDYYKKGEGFEIYAEEGLGTQNQVCGGGEYEGGVGFAIGIERLILLKSSIPIK